MEIKITTAVDPSSTQTQTSESSVKDRFAVPINDGYEWLGVIVFSEKPRNLSSRIMQSIATKLAGLLRGNLSIISIYFHRRWP